MGAMLVWTGSNYPFCGAVATVQADYAMKRSASIRQGGAICRYPLSDIPVWRGRAGSA
ncbi:hypothetical protein AERO8C_160011 [Aeromonas veronii]|uniref:Uncharacterized protein n=1 Tax=Aeromonas veronii TaxID=654 RepID=A0A653KXC3_AERVE|nr:hypothetical protein AERO8C_160011 [Aeromonas veronii]